MTVDELYKFVLFIAKKSQSGANPSPSEFNLALDRAYTEWVMDKYGNDSQIIPQTSTNIIAWQKNQKISDDLTYLLENRQFDVNSQGRFNKPDGSTVEDTEGQTAPDYMHFSSMRHPYVLNCDGEYIEREVDVKIMRDDEIGAVFNSRIVPPKMDFPIAAIYDNYIQVYPKEVRRVKLSYLRTPTKPVWAYTEVNGRPVYDQTTSVQLESPDDTHNDIAMRVLRYLGVSIREPQLFQYANAMEKEGI